MLLLMMSSSGKPISSSISSAPSTWPTRKQMWLSLSTTIGTSYFMHMRAECPAQFFLLPARTFSEALLISTTLPRSLQRLMMYSWSKSKFGLPRWPKALTYGL